MNNSIQGQSGALKRVFLLGGDDRWRTRIDTRRVRRCRSERSLQRTMDAATRCSIWISPRSEETDELLRAATRHVEQHRMEPRAFGDLVMLRPPRPRTLPSLRGWFDRVVGEVNSFKILPIDQLLEVLGAPTSEGQDLVIGGTIDVASQTLALVRGDLQPLTIPLSLFRASGRNKPDFNRFAVAQYGHVIRLGAYEAAVDAVLYEFDLDYRRRLEAKRRPA